MLLQSRRKVVLLNISWPVPRSEESVLPEVTIQTSQPGDLAYGQQNVPIVGKIDFGAKAEQFSIQDNSTAVVSTSSVHERKTNVDENAMEFGISQDCEE